MQRLCFIIVAILIPTLVSGAKLRNYSLSYDNQMEKTIDDVGNVAGIVQIFTSTGGRCSVDHQEEYYYLRCTRPSSAAPPAKLTVGGILRGDQVMVDTVEINGGTSLPEDKWVTLLIQFRIAAQRLR